MTIDWNQPEDISQVNTYSGGTTTIRHYASNNYKGTSNIDYFPDNFATGDMLFFVNTGYLGIDSHAHRFSGLKVLVDTPIQADTYEYVWEYPDTSGTWKPLPNLNDPSNGLTIAGEHSITWDVPSDWSTSLFYKIGGQTISGYAVRLRVTNVVNPIEGGKQGNQNVKQYNYAYRIINGDEHTPEDIYNYDVSLGNNLMTKYNENYYKLLINLIIHDGQLTIDSAQTLQVGDETNTWNMILRQNGTLYMKNANLLWFGDYKHNEYLTWAGNWIMTNNSYFLKGGHTYYRGLQINANLAIEDSMIETGGNSDVLYLGTSSSGYIKNSLLAVSRLYAYIPELSLENIKFVTNKYVTSLQYLLAGNNLYYAILNGIDFQSQMDATSTQGCCIILLDCKNFNTGDSSITAGTNTYGKYPNQVWEAYTMYIKVIDKNGNPIQGAKVYLLDKNGKTAWIKDLYKTDNVHGTLRYYDTTSGTLYGTTNVINSLVGKIVRLDSEFVNFVSYNSPYGTFERNQSWNGYDSFFIGGYTSYIMYEILDYIETDSNGEVTYSGANGTFYPYVVTHMWGRNYDETTVDQREYEFSPFTLIVDAPNYEIYKIENIDLRESRNFIVKLTKEKAFVLDVTSGNVFYNLNKKYPDKKINVVRI